MSDWAARSSSVVRHILGRHVAIDDCRYGLHAHHIPSQMLAYTRRSRALLAAPLTTTITTVATTITLAAFAHRHQLTQEPRQPTLNRFGLGTRGISADEWARQPLRWMRPVRSTGTMASGAVTHSIHRPLMSSRSPTADENAVGGGTEVGSARALPYSTSASARPLPLPGQSDSRPTRRQRNTGRERLNFIPTV